MHRSLLNRFRDANTTPHPIPPSEAQLHIHDAQELFRGGIHGDSPDDLGQQMRVQEILIVQHLQEAGLDVDSDQPYRDILNVSGREEFHRIMNEPAMPHATSAAPSAAAPSAAVTPEHRHPA